MLAELIHSDGFKSTKRIGKIMHLFSFLIKCLDPSCTDNYKFLMGSLFSLGGLLKIEAKSYLHTLKQADANYHLVCPLFDEENPID